MRKFLSMLLVLTLMFALAVPAFAAESHTLSGSNVYGTEAGDTALPSSSGLDINVCGKLTRGDNAWGGAIYKVQVSWNVTPVTGSYVNTYVWTPGSFDTQGSTPRYCYVNNALTSATNAGNVTITIKNRSNDYITGTLKYVSEKSGDNNYTTFKVNNAGTDTVAILVQSASQSITVPTDGRADVVGAETSQVITGKVELEDAGINYLGTSTAQSNDCNLLGKFTVTLTKGSDGVYNQTYTQGGT